MNLRVVKKQVWQYLVGKADIGAVNVWTNDDGTQDPPIVGDGTIPYLMSLIAHPEKMNAEGDFYDDSDPGAISGAVAFLYFAEGVNRRIASGGLPQELPNPGGRHARQYQLHINCYHRSRDPDAAALGARNDDLLDGLVSAIMADTSAGGYAEQSEAVFQWGEGDVQRGGPDVTTEMFFPKVLTSPRSTIQIYSRTSVLVSGILDV